MPDNTKNKRYLPSRPSDKEEMVRFVVDKINNGEKHKNINAELIEKFNLKNIDALTIINESKDAVRNQLQIKVPFILSTHIERYEYLYTKFEIIERTDLQNKCLSQKEDLLNIRQSLTKRLTEGLGNQEIENKFNFKKLDKNQQQRAMELIAKGML